MKLKYFVFSLLLIAFAFNCSKDKEGDRTVLRLAYDADPVTLDIHEQLSGGMLQHSHLVFDPLIRWTKEHTFEPRLATSYERVNDTTVRFKLRKGVKFHSGNDFSAKDVVFTVNRLKKSGDFKAIFEPIKEVVAIDDYTIDISTKSPYPLLVSSATYIFPLDSKFYEGKDEIKKQGETFASTNSSGTGPFQVTERQQGVKVVYERFSEYWDKDSIGTVKKIILKPIKEDATRVAALLSGDVDFIAPVPPNDFDRIKESEKTKLIEMSGTRIIFFHMNQDRREELKNPKVRQAIVYAVDNISIVKKIMRGFATPAGQMSPIGYLGHNPSLTPRHDLEKAKTLMKEAGYENGFSITMMAPNNRYVNDEKIAQAVTSMLAKINIQVDLKTMPKAQYWPAYDNRQADMMMIGWHSDTEDSANFYEFLTMCKNDEKGFGAYNAGEYCNPKVDELTLKSGSETDPEKRTAILQKIEEIMYNESAFLPLHWQNLSWASNIKVKAEDIVNVMNFPYFGDLVIEE